MDMVLVKVVCRLVGMLLILADITKSDTVNIGFPIESSTDTFEAVGNLFIFDGVTVPEDGTLQALTGNFINTRPFTVHFWRPDVNVINNNDLNLRLVHEVTANPFYGSGQETIVLHEMDNPECYTLEKGDILGVFIASSSNSLTFTTNFNSPSALLKNFPSPGEYPIIGDLIGVDGLGFPYQFSINANIDIGNATNATASGFSGPNCTEFFARAQAYQDSLNRNTTTTVTVKGDIGATGATGPQGIPGVTGLMGPPGINGASGEKGEKGDPGSQGIQGVPGESALNMSRGVKGDVGPKGDIGLTGLPGSTGEMGVKGDTGPMGYNGSAGASGERGIQGNKGERGDPGTGVGATGVQGPAGERGAPGLIGPVGPPGPVANGTGVQAPNAGASVGNQNSSLVLKDSIIILLLIWQCITTIVMMSLCICYVMRRKAQSSKVSSLDYVPDMQISNIDKKKRLMTVGGKYEGTVTRKGSLVETNLNWSYTKTAPANLSQVHDS